MIILTILVLSVGFIGMNIQKLVKEQRFKTEVAILTDQLRLAQDIMLILNADVLVKFTRESNGFTSRIEVENILSKGWQREIKRQLPSYTTIQTLEFDDPNSNIKTQTSPFDLLFLSGGSIMSQGILRVASSGKELEAFIFLPGYPYPIEHMQDIEKKMSGRFQTQADYFEKLTFYARREVEDMMTKK